MDGSAEGRLSLRAICKEGSTSLQTLSAISFVLRVSLVDANSPPLPPAPAPRSRKEDDVAGKTAPELLASDGRGKVRGFHEVIPR
jgi:hypothetical protein